MVAEPIPAAQTPRWGVKIGGERVLLLVAALYVGGLSLWPLLRLFAEAFASDDGQVLGLLTRTWLSRSTQRALANTLEASLISSLISVALGSSLALLTVLSNVRAKTALVFTFLLPWLIPPQITAMAWAELAGPGSPILKPLGLAPAPGSTNPLYSGWGVALVMGVEHAALAFLAVRAGLSAVPGNLIEAARIGGAKPWAILRRIILPVLRAPLLAGAALAFVSAIGNFGVPALLGIPGRYPTLTTLIYQRLNGFGPKVLGEVAALALILAVLAAFGLAIRAVLANRSRFSLERGAPLAPFTLGRWRPLVETLCWAVLLIIAVLPLLSLVAASLVPAVGVELSVASVTFKNFLQVLVEQDSTQRAFLNSFLLASTAAILSAAFALPLAWLLVFRRSRTARVLDLIADAPYAVPGIVLSIGIILVFLKPLPIIGITLYGTMGILLLAYIARFFALALRPVVAGLESLDRSYEEAGQIAGASLMQRLRLIVLPLAAPSAAAGALMVFLTAFNELTVSALLWSTGNETLGVIVFQLQYEGNSPAASAVAVVTVIVTLGAAALFDRLGRHLPAGVVPWRS
jgi:iron(III) transport system permease protein